jgi:mono/diheme cytochrome c family protein
MRAGLAIISIIVLAIHGVVFYKQFYAPWQDYQKEYFSRAVKLSDNAAVKATLRARTPEIEQTIVRSFGPERVDRCRTCHIAADDVRFARADQPLRSHPQIPGHKFDTFGCTICHDGQGRAVDAKHAHEGGGEDWPWPILPKELIQANCVQCHTQPGWAYAPLVNEGRQLFFQRACYTCHTIAGLSYGSIGPELTEVGRTRRFDYILRKIQDPRATNPTSTMPKQDLTDHQRMALTAFLKSQQGSLVSRAPLTQFVAKQERRPEWLPVERIVGPQTQGLETMTAAERGRVLLPQVGCLSCHKLDDRDGKVGPELAFTAVQRDHTWLMTHFHDPKSVVPGSVMPPYPLPEPAFDSLSVYLLSRKPPAVPADPAAQFQRLCSRCHGAKGEGDGVIANYLDPKPRDLSKAAFMKTKSRDRLIHSLRYGVAGTSMAPWGGVLDDQAAGKLIDWVLADVTQGSSVRRVERKVPQANPVPYSKESVARGEAIFLDRCWGCHGKKADGHGPNAESIVPRPRNLRNTPFIRSVAYARLHESIQYGVQGTAMPAAGFDFALDERSIGDLINYIYSLNRLGSAQAPANQVARKEK